MAKCGKDGFDDAVGISKDVVIPESNNFVSLTLKPCRAFCIAPNLPCVLAAIDLDHELALGTDEIDDVPSDGRLAANEIPIELPAAQPRPQALLSLGWVLSKPPSGFACHGAILPPSLTLPHKEGGDFFSTPLANSVSHERGRDPRGPDGARYLLPPP